MEFNNGNERRKLNKKWERLRVQYQQAGMSEDAIQAIFQCGHSLSDGGHSQQQANLPARALSAGHPA